ncbi:MAG: hypothetical protein WC858_03750 [Parcubacteria group bacterium]|jgi:hypothetical protein
MKNAINVPISDFASSKLNRNFNKYFWPSYVMSFMAGAYIFTFIFVLLPVFLPNLQDVPRFSTVICVYAILTVAVTWPINFVLIRKAWKKGKEKILQQNEIDYVKSLALKSLLEAFVKPELNEYPVLGNEYQAGWRPFRVEHHLSNFLRGEMSGKVCLVRGMIIPNLLDHSSVIFLKNGENTLRVLIPSPRTAKELLVRTLEHWLRELPKDSHTYEVLRQFAVDDENFVNQLSHPQIIDSLDAACELPFESRPEVIVRGEEIQGGIVLATSMQFNEKAAIFLPSGFFRELTEKIHPFIGTAKEPILIETIKEE